MIIDIEARKRDRQQLHVSSDLDGLKTLSMIVQCFMIIFGKACFVGLEVFF